MKILNITADYPDSIHPNKTLAVKLLLDSSCHEHFVISINRCNNPSMEKWEEVEGGVSISYFSPPMGLMLRLFLNRLTGKILDYINEKKITFDFVIAHKMTIEGLIASKVATTLSVKYGVSLWGSTDKKFIKLKPELHFAYKGVYLHSAVVFPASPWVRSFVEHRLGVTNASVTMLPVITNNTLRKVPSSDQLNFVSVFNLDLYKLKGLLELLRALSVHEGDWSLDIYGAGTEGAVNRINSFLRVLNLSSRVNLMGRVENDDITEVLSNYHSFLMPTKSETYGMVYIEALFAGIPILYSRGQGIDGYFEAVDIGVRVSPGSEKSIGSGLDDLVFNRSRYVENISNLHDEGFFDQFKKDSIVTVFDQVIAEVGCSD